MSSPTLDRGAGRRLRISYIASSYMPFLNGVSFAVHRRARWLLRRGHHVQLMRPQINDQFASEVHQRDMPDVRELAAFPEFYDAPYPALPHPFSQTYPVPKSFRHWNVDELLAEFQPDVILLEDLPSLVGLSSPLGGGYRRPIATAYARRAHIPTVTLIETDWLKYAATYFGRVPLAMARPFLWPLFHWVFRAYDRHFYSARSVLEEAVRFGICNAEVLAFHGVMADEYVPQNRRFDPIPNDPRPILLFVGRLVPEKNVTELLDAFAHIHRRFPEAHLVIVGSGPLEHRLRERAQVFGSSVSFVGEAFRETLKGWYARADLLVNPSTSETFCTTNIEALASGTPVIAAASGGNLEQIIDGQNGLLARPNDPRDLSEKIIGLLADPARLVTLSAQARDSVLHLDWNSCCERLEAKLLELIDRKQRSK